MTGHSTGARQNLASHIEAEKPCQDVFGMQEYKYRMSRLLLRRYVGRGSGYGGLVI